MAGVLAGELLGGPRSAGGNAGKLELPARKAQRQHDDGAVAGAAKRPARREAHRRGRLRDPAGELGESRS